MHLIIDFVHKLICTWKASSKNTDKILESIDYQTILLQYNNNVHGLIIIYFFLLSFHKALKMVQLGFYINL